MTLMNFDLRMERSLERGEGECKSVLEKLVVNEHLHLLTHAGRMRERERERKSVCTAEK